MLIHNHYHVLTKKMVNGALGLHPYSCISLSLQQIWFDSLLNLVLSKRIYAYEENY